MLIRRCREADLRYFHPHAFRHALIAEIEKSNLTEEVKETLSSKITSVISAPGQHSALTDMAAFLKSDKIEILKGFDIKCSGMLVAPRMHPEDIALLAEQVAAKMKNTEKGADSTG